MKKFKTVTKFLEEIGFSCKGRQGQYSYVDHEKKMVFFGIDQNNGDNENLILSAKWEYDHKRKTKSGRSYKRGNYTTSLDNIHLVQDSGYQLVACKIKTVQKDGKTTKSNLFDIDNLRTYRLKKVGDDYCVQ
ncbi:hypothetical protein AYY19_18430 [Photobacterium aquimaris]|uniref:Uncharacterized protein n=1 Tax=Photobacterium aquimaris TaxID=512643 RepID=A0A2T3IQW3_9GAMM|nr:MULTISPECIES: hypothetical protein [Vibrionaceae]OBU14996.1 hypothetical protein AYY19_18430 [Photobacterium aquimaris]OBU18104.1 hypothetical protein AYY20_18595 [Photobacterium aquimaris]OZT84169.1 hypothetical protein CIK04_14155 [Vibrio sp. 03_296]PJO11081.1 hypothetical protein COO31_020935 [Vibrio vulnificus]PSU30725.1 hypothetical protein CTM88_03735 [Photobacterium aquimaris]